MIINFFLLLALTSPLRDPVATALESFRHVASYRVTIRSRSEGSATIIRYFYRKPGFVRMEFIKPHNGAVLVYNPVKKEAQLQPFGFIKSLVLTLAPDNRLITTPTGHRVDASDPGAFLERVKKLAEHGKIVTMGNEKIGGKEALIVDVQGEEGFVVSGGIHRYLLWLDIGTLLPLKTKSFDLRNEPVEEVLMDNPEINIDLPDSLFDL
jgi:hypothetical protein